MPGRELQKQPWTMLQLSTGVSKHTVVLLLRFNENSKQSKNVWLRKLKINPVGANSKINARTRAEISSHQERAK